MARRLDHEKLNARIKAIESAIEYREKRGEWERVEDSVEELCVLVTKGQDDSVSIAKRFEMTERMLALCQALIHSNLYTRHTRLVDKSLVTIEAIIEEFKNWRHINIRASSEQTTSDGKQEAKR